MALLPIIMTPFSWLYGIGIFFRNMMYNVGLIPVFHSPVPVISVGNITAGGTGKTPFVEYLVKRYIEKGYKPCVLSRGYRRITRGMQVVSDGMTISGNALSAGDEPYQIAKKFPGAMVVVAEKRAIAADYAMRKFKPNLFILDDGFQHRSMGRNVDIVVIDGTRELDKIPLLPAGLRREPISSLKRADLLIRSHAEKNEDVETGMSKIDLRYVVKKFRSLAADDSYSPEQMFGKRCVVFSGIGNPESLISTLKEVKIEIMAFHKYADHYIYKENDLEMIRGSMETTKADFVVTTEKDSVRLESLRLSPVFPTRLFLSVIIEAAIVRGEEFLSRTLDEKIDRYIR